MVHAYPGMRRHKHHKLGCGSVLQAAFQPFRKSIPLAQLIHKSTNRGRIGASNMDFSLITIDHGEPRRAIIRCQNAGGKGIIRAQFPPHSMSCSRADAQYDLTRHGCTGLRLRQVQICVEFPSQIRQCSGSLDFLEADGLLPFSILGIRQIENSMVIPENSLPESGKRMFLGNLPAYADDA